MLCPFVPVSGVTMDECVELAHRLGKRVGEELGLPVYLYEYAATRPERTVAGRDIGRASTRRLPKSSRRPEFAPDYGPAKLSCRAFGAMVIGARKFLVAYNVNLNVTDKRWANRVAFDVREKGRTVEARTAERFNKPGLLKAVRGSAGSFPSTVAPRSR